MSAPRFIKCVTVRGGAISKTCMLISYTSNTFPIAIPHAIALVRAADKRSPREAVEFVLQLLKVQEALSRLKPLSWKRQRKPLEQSWKAILIPLSLPEGKS